MKNGILNYNSAQYREVRNTEKSDFSVLLLYVINPAAGKSSG